MVVFVFLPLLSWFHFLHFQGQKLEKTEAKETNGVAEEEEAAEEEEEEEEEEDDEDDESSDPDIEEEIQASTQQDGPGQFQTLAHYKLYSEMTFICVNLKV